jgi:hypothetical protein
MIKDEIQAPQEQSTSSKSTETKTTSASTPTQKKSVVTKVTETTSEVVKKITNIFTSDKDTKTTNTPTPNTPSQEQKPTSEKNAVFNETRYTIQNNKIVDENGNVIYTLSSNASSSAR